MPAHASIATLASDNNQPTTGLGGRAGAYRPMHSLRMRSGYREQQAPAAVVQATEREEIGPSFKRADEQGIDGLLDDVSPEMLEGLEEFLESMSAEVQAEQVLESISHSLSQVQDAEQRIMQFPSSSLRLSRALHALSRTAARFVEEQAQLVNVPGVGLGDLREAQRRCHAGNEVLQAMVSACSPESLIRIREELIHAVNVDRQSLAQAAVAISLRAVEPVSVYQEFQEVAAAAAGAAATTVLSTIRSAHDFGLGPRDRVEIHRAVLRAINTLPQGQVVVTLLNVIRKMNQTRDAS